MVFSVVAQENIILIEIMSKILKTAFFTRSSGIVFCCLPARYFIPIRLILEFFSAFYLAVRLILSYIHIGSSGRSMDYIYEKSIFSLREKIITFSPVFVLISV